jgi:hypothetical protein
MKLISKFLLLGFFLYYQTVMLIPVLADTGYNRPLVYFPGLYRGSRFFVDGPLWYDGDAVLEQYDHNNLKISINMRVPNIAMAYKIIDNRISIAIGLARGADTKLSLTINDFYGRKNYFIPNVRLRFGETEGGWFTRSKEFIRIIALNQVYTFIIQEPGRLSLTSNIVPGSLSLIKRD